MSLPPFQSLLDRYREPVYRFLVATAGPQYADDCFQETFLAALAAYPRLRRGSNLRAWLFTIAYRKAMDSHRTRRKDRATGPAVEKASPSTDGYSDIWDAVKRLPPKQRAAVFHRYAADLPYKDIANVLGSTDAAARQNVREGLKKLKEVFS